MSRSYQIAREALSVNASSVGTLEAVKLDGLVLEHIQRPSLDVAVAAILQNPDAARFIPDSVWRQMQKDLHWWAQLQPWQQACFVKKHMHTRATYSQVAENGVLVCIREYSLLLHPKLKARLTEKRTRLREGDKLERTLATLRKTRGKEYGDSIFGAAAICEQIDQPHERSAVIRYLEKGVPLVGRPAVVNMHRVGIREHVTQKYFNRQGEVLRQETFML